jgi:hypothetical protein
MQQVSSHDHGRSCSAQSPTGGGLSSAETGHTSWPSIRSVGSSGPNRPPSRVDQVQRIRQRRGATGPARRARASRRLRARRSSSDSPPQTPVSWPDSIAHFMQESTTSHRRHTAFASSIWTSAGPVCPSRLEWRRSHTEPSIPRPGLGRHRPHPGTAGAAELRDPGNQRAQRGIRARGR